jgi:predicted enzyme related to lactoylglutathione lyase
LENQIVWVDIPVLDLTRAIKFYSAILGAEVRVENFQGQQFGLLPHSHSGVSGCLVEKDPTEICGKGPLLYFNANGRIEQALQQVKSYGGQLLSPKESLGEHGFRAIILDSEGNRIVLHSN